MSPKFRGMYFMLLASITFSAMSIFVRLGSITIPTIELVFFRNLIGLLFVVPSFYWHPVNQPFNFKKLPLLIFRGLMGTAALSIIFYNFKHISLGLTATYVQTSPIFIAIFSFVLLKESLLKSSWLAILIGFIGIVFLFNPSIAVPLKFHIWGVISGIGTAIAYTSVRKLNQYFETRLIILSFLVCGTIFPAVLMLYGYYSQAPTDGIFITTFNIPKGVGWLHVFMIGVTALLGQIYMTRAYGSTKAGIVATTGYFQIFFTAWLGIFFGDPMFQWMEIIGIVLIIISGIVIAYEKDDG